MKKIGLILTLFAVTACEPSTSPRSEPVEEPRQSGISVSGYGRVGVSTRF